MTSAPWPAVTISKLVIILSLDLCFVSEAQEQRRPFRQLGASAHGRPHPRHSGPPCLPVPRVPPSSPFLLPPWDRWWGMVEAAPPLAGRTTRPPSQASVPDCPPPWLGVAHRKGRRASHPWLECHTLILPRVPQIAQPALCVWGRAEEPCAYTPFCRVPSTRGQLSRAPLPLRRARAGHGDQAAHPAESSASAGSQRPLSPRAEKDAFRKGGAGPGGERRRWLGQQHLLRFRSLFWNLGLGWGRMGGWESGRGR